MIIYNLINRSKAGSLLFCALFLLVSLTNIFGQETKRIQKSFSGKKEVKITHRYGPMEIKKSTDGQVKAEAVISFETQKQEDRDELLKQFDLEASESGDLLELSTLFDVKNWSTNNKETKLEFKNGKKIKNIKDLSIELLVYIPEVNNLILSNKYEEITIEVDLRANVSVNLYSGDFTAKNINGNFKANAKYSDITVGNVEVLDLELYDCDVTIGHAKGTRINSKFSDINIGSVGQLVLNSYENDISLGAIKGTLTVEDKYSEITFTNFTSARMDLYDSDINAEAGQDLMIKSKYSDLKFISLNSVNFELSFDDDFSIQSLGALTAHSKYTDFSIKNLGSKLVMSSYDDNINIDSFKGPLENITFDGKFSDLKIPLGNAQKYVLVADLTFGDLIIDKGHFEEESNMEKNGNLAFKGRIKGASEDAPKVTIKSYDGNIKLK